MKSALFSEFFRGEAWDFTVSTIRASLLEDGKDLSTNGVFPPEARLHAHIVAKEETMVAGLDLFESILSETSSLEPGLVTPVYLVAEGNRVAEGTTIVELSGSARIILRAERVLLNFLCHLSGIANLTAQYVAKLEGTGVRLLDTRKTLPGLRYPEKYAVRVGGGFNHRKNLGELLMLKDNHIDAAGSITKAVELLRRKHPDLPIEVECETAVQVKEAVNLGVSRIMFDNMTLDEITTCLRLVPRSIEVEISGNVTLESIRDIALQGEERKADFISVGRLTHSARYADFSMRIFS